MKKRKIIQKVISSSILILLLNSLLIILWSADWFMDNFGGVEFSTVIYQLFSPLKGTESRLIHSYCREGLYPAICLSFIFLFLYHTYDSLLGKLVLKFDIHIWKKTFQLILGNKFRYISKSIAVVLGLFYILSCIHDKALLMGIPEYIKQITNASSLFETEYISPGEVSIQFPDAKRNLLLIYMESMETTYASVDAGGGKPCNYIPELTQLAEENLYFSNDEDLGGAGAYSGMGWTMGALLASSAGVPYKLPIDGNDAGEYEYFLPGLTGIGDILGDAGYHNYFMCGSDISFAGRLDFFSQHGGYRIWDYESAKADGIIPEDYHVFWGMEDEYLYEYARQKLTEIAGRGENFNFTILTVDTHHTDGYICRLCQDEYTAQFANVASCASRQAAAFIDWAKEQDWYENTTIVITGDHLSMKTDFWEDIGGYDRRIYNCFINLPDGLTAEHTINREFSVMDMFPTMLTAIGVEIEGERLGLGTNLFSDEPTLPEKMGKDLFEAELGAYSEYYHNNFIMQKGSFAGEK